MLLLFAKLQIVDIIIPRCALTTLTRDSERLSQVVSTNNGMRNKVNIKQEIAITLRRV